jgi:DNA-binding IscR family transcriptional regulator
MQKLVKAGILKGMRGASGGYLLARDRKNINVAEVYEIIKNLSKTRKLDESNFILTKLVIEINDRIETDLTRILKQITLEKIYNNAKKIKAPMGKNNKTDFII